MGSGMIDIISKVIDFIKYIITILAMIVALISSLFMPVETGIKSIEKTRVEYINDIGPEIIRCINKRDKFGLSNLFCDKIKNTDYLNKQIDFFFCYIDKSNEIEFNSGTWVDSGGHGSNNHGRKVVDRNGWEYDKEILINDKKYSLYCGAYITLLGHREYEGITHILFYSNRDLSNLDVEEFNIAFNDRNSTKYMGIGIFDFNYDTLRYENIAPKEIFENEDCKFSFDELEEGRSKW